VTWSLNGHPLRAVLVSRLRYLGDIAMTTPVLEILRRGDPDLDIGYLCEAAYAPLLAGHPHLNRLHALVAHRSSSDAKIRREDESLVQPKDTMTGIGEESSQKRNSGFTKGTWAMARELRRHRYDLCVDLFFNPRSAWLLRFSGSRWRIGGSQSWRRRLYTHTILPAKPEQEPQFWTKTGGGLGDHLSRLTPLRHVESDLPFLGWLSTRAGEKQVHTHIAAPSLVGSLPERTLTGFGLDPARGYILLAPGSTWPAKEWPVEHWSTLIDIIARTASYPLVVLKPPLRTELYEKLAAAIPEGRGGVLPYLSLTDALRVVAAASLLVCGMVQVRFR